LSHNHKIRNPNPGPALICRRSNVVTDPKALIIRFAVTTQGGSRMP